MHSRIIGIFVKGSFLVQNINRHMYLITDLFVKKSHTSYYYDIFLSFGCQFLVVFAAI